MPSATTGVPEAQLIIDLTETDLPADTPVYVYIVGLVVNTFYYIAANGLPTVMNTSDNTVKANEFPDMHKLTKEAQEAIAPNYPLAWADWSMKVDVGSNLVLPLGQINTTNIPNLGTGTSAFSGRIYLSVGVPRLPFTVQSGGYAAPVYGGVGGGPTGSLTLYDWIEFSYDSEGNFNGNTTQVNQFGFPLHLQGTPVGGKPYPTQGRLDTDRLTILRKIAAGPEPLFGAPVMIPVPEAARGAPPKDKVKPYPDRIEYFRAISPVTVSGDNNTLNTYYDSDIATAYAAWQATPLVTYDGATGYYSGVVFPTSNSIPTPSDYPPGSLAFYQGNYATMAALATAVQGGATPSFYLTGSGNNVVTSNDIWQCANSLNTGRAAQQNVGKMIGAAFNRGMMVSASQAVTTSLDDTTCSAQSGSFYAAGTTFNPWAQAFHLYNKNGLAYGFSYDDVCEQNPSIPPSGASLVATFIRITLGKFYG